MPVIKVYRDHAHRPRPRRFLDAIVAGAPRAGLAVKQITKYEPFDGVLVSYGNGRPDLSQMIERHMAQGGRVVHLDVGYWGKAFRMAVDGLHPRTLLDGGPERFDAQGFTLTNDYSPEGPILLIGMGPKSRHVGPAWEEQALARIRAAFPGRRVIFRPKPKRPHPLLPIETDAVTPIEQLLRGASLVVTRHSNVGIDAAFQGIPVCTETGAASCLYGNDLNNPLNPSEEQRRDFLRRLAWWNWEPREAPAIWRWIMSSLSSIPSRTG